MKEKKNVVILLLVIIGVFICGGASAIYVKQENDKSLASVYFSFMDTSTTEQEKVFLYNTDGRYYAFLPSYFDLKKVYVTSSKGYSIQIDGEEYTEKHSCENLVLNQEYSIELSNTFGQKIKKETVVIMKSEKLPTLSITLEDTTLKKVNANKENEGSGTLRIISDDASMLYEGNLASIHGRGNSTWLADKKSYGIKLEEEAALLDMGEAKKWILLSNCMDSSSLRNKIVYDAAQQTNMAYTPEAKYVELYVNGEYLGLYLLCEKIEVAQNRLALTELEKNTETVNTKELKDFSRFSEKKDGLLRKGFSIENDPEDITGGYLAEVVLPGRVDEKSSCFQLNQEEYFAIDYPEECSKAQIEYIADVFANIDSNLNNEEITKYIDLPSWVEYYLMQEVFGNTEQASFYYYKDSDKVDSKVYAGPIWDFDLALGSELGWEEEEVKADVLYVATCSFYKNLYENETFLQAVKKEYTSNFRKIVSQVLETKIDEYFEEIETAYLLNGVRWGNITFENLKNADYITLEESMEEIRNYLEARLSFCDSIWGEEEASCSICIHMSYPQYAKYYVSVEKGSVFSDFLEIGEYPGYVFKGWYDEDTGEPCDLSGEVINTNRKFMGYWVEDENFQLPLKYRIRKFVMANSIVIICVSVMFCIMIGSLFYLKHKK